MSPRQFGKLITAPRREGADPVRKGRPWSLPLENRVLLVAAHWRINLTLPSARSEYGYSASHSRFFRGLRLRLVYVLQDCSSAFALTGAKADERETLLDLLDAEPELLATRPGQTLIGDRNYFSRDLEQPADRTRHHGRMPAGVVARLMQRILTADRPHVAQRPERTAHPARSLTGYDH